MRLKTDRDTVITLRGGLEIEGRAAAALADRVHALLSEEIPEDDYRVFVTSAGVLRFAGFAIEVWHAPAHWNAVCKALKVVAPAGDKLLSIDVHNRLMVEEDPA